MASPQRPRPGDNGGLERVALEIKVTRGDFLQDVRDPAKQAPWRELAERHAYAVPAGLVRPAEVPGDSGLLEVTDRLTVTWTRLAPRNHTARPLPLANQIDAFYRWSRAEARIKGLDHAGLTEGDPDAMRAEFARLRRQVEQLDGQRERAEAAAAGWKRRYAALDPPTCRACGKPIRPARRSRGSAYDLLEWEHAPDDEAWCKALRTARALEAEEAKPVEDRWGVYVAEPEPLYPWDEETEPGSEHDTGRTSARKA